MDKEVVVYIHNGILAIKRNTFESVLMRWINVEPVKLSQLYQKEKDKHFYFLEEKVTPRK